MVSHLIKINLLIFAGNSGLKFLEGIFITECCTNPVYQKPSLLQLNREGVRKPVCPPGPAERYFRPGAHCIHLWPAGQGMHFSVC